MAVKISDLADAGALSASDYFAVSQGADTFRLAWSNLLSTINANIGFSEVNPANYDSTPVVGEPGRINFTDTTGLEVGMPMRTTQAAVNRYYVIDTINVDHILLAGPPITQGVNIDSLVMMPRANAVQVDIFCPSTFLVGGVTNTLIKRSTNVPFQWQLPPAYLVQINCAQGQPNAVTPGRINALIENSSISTDNSDDGVILSDTADIWTRAAAGTIAQGSYRIERYEALELGVTVAGDEVARDLIASLIFVLE